MGMDDIKSLVEYAVGHPERVDELLIRLDRMARDYDGYEYGLPTSMDTQMAAMREAVYQWLLSLQKKEGSA